LFAARLSATAVDESAQAPAVRAGDRIGPYRILREIGRGGMGTVFLAERAEEYQQRVALKIVHDSRSSEALRWFKEERQILAGLRYHLLTGRSPYDVRSDAPHHLAAAICDEEPRRPSAIAGTRRLRRQLSGDLDTIVLKALKKDPASRYSSAGALADDVSRH